jgi:hypothetical protein
VDAQLKRTEGDLQAARTSSAERQEHSGKIKGELHQARALAHAALSREAEEQQKQNNNKIKDEIQKLTRMVLGVLMDLSSIWLAQLFVKKKGL